MMEYLEVTWIVKKNKRLRENTRAGAEGVRDYISVFYTIWCNLFTILNYLKKGTNSLGFDFK